MIVIKPVSDLRNDFGGIEKIVAKGDPVFLTKNGRGTMVVMSIEKYESLTPDIEAMLDEADAEAAKNSKRLTEDEVFGVIRKKVHDKTL